MILVTVGTQLPFDRLIRMMDEIAPELDKPVKAQIGKSSYTPENIEWMVNIDPVDFDRLFGEASIIVAHAGIGTVLTAKRFSKPIILVARKADLGEHRNDHQNATVGQLRGRPGVYVAADQEELKALLKSDLKAASADGEDDETRSTLIENVRLFIEEKL